MKRLMVLAFLALASACWAEPQIGRISVSSPAEVRQLQDLGCSIYSDEVQGFVDVIFDEGVYRRLLVAGYAIEDIVSIPYRETDLIDPEFHTYEELTAALATLEAQYPALCKVDSIGRATQFPRTMWAVKLSDNVATEEDEMAVFYLGTHHASEVMGCETILYMIDHFLQNYGLDPDITNWMNTYEIWFVPLVNPDGHYAVTSNINLFWRKNARDIDGDGIFYEFMGGTWWTDDHEGIDPNRNYSWYWNMDGSSDPWAYNYRGASPFSESENVAIRALAFTQRFALGISFHSYGEVVIAPWTWTGGQFAPDQDVINSIGNAMADQFIKDNGSGFAYDIYPGQGGRCPNWFYGLAGAIAYDVEVNPYPMFIPPGSQLAERAQRYMNGATYLLERMAGPGITGHVRDAVSGQPLAARVEIQGRISEQVRPRYAEPQYGRFTRLLNNGTYTVMAGLPGYVTQRIQGVAVNNTWTPLEIQLVPTASGADKVVQSASRPTARLHAERSSAGQIVLSLNLDQAGRVKLDLFNLRGQRISSLVDGYRQAGAQQINVNASGLPSGVYFARLTGEGVPQAVKVVLFR
jgi:hypothetical protein